MMVDTDWWLLMINDWYWLMIDDGWYWLMIDNDWWLIMIDDWYWLRYLLMSCHSKRYRDRTICIKCLRTTFSLLIHPKETSSNWFGYSLDSLCDSDQWSLLEGLLSPIVHLLFLFHLQQNIEMVRKTYLETHEWAFEY